MKENNINNVQNQSKWQEAASSQNYVPETKKGFSVLIILFLLIFIFLVIVVIFFLVNSKPSTSEDNNTSSQSAQRSFDIEQATSEATTKTEQDNQSEGIIELNNLNDELDDALVDLENSLVDIEDYQTQDDTMPTI
ncbi:hypothetical protein A2X44_04260 [candidate division CPR3 bacterium GWF2_35_18]|uniref:Uncharacterized protein n=1 Tax=candidate division CPR3 bacterium GW2011_GWF2_35_18 TaxID=1618350 RepID=A0A0G0EPU7_UNCC3|nr:MAG: hypothetical protein UR67_C0007G0042 [candidate division CPR3 bacterium GW2011_GWF2_35_18]OGB62569.1 MAG: hypothetical protein A2X44_04260 [candidate division CPR3 bacterium GWF2_35_18]OGB65820.1 MAG: hypothetical protein A2250_01510 [candidate division CPR3 bacterium RIFOXYA2_FULL_35_13]OGB77129.1 MAG: hypothetical protein A2476_01930 [candidate division CPR3 bacterium RIFOXYC2_FULL_35_7]OGB79207.1 MAG: hypothetical protein A2296_04225 [candidate division CPR3 bacterium RIFOXYB2_FULL_3